MKYFTTTSKASLRAVDCVIVGVYNRGKLTAAAAELDAASKGQIRALIKSGDIATEPGRCTILQRLDGVKAARVAVAGLGKPEDLDAIVFKKAVEASVKALADGKVKQFLNTLTTETVKGSSVLSGAPFCREHQRCCVSV